MTRLSILLIFLSLSTHAQLLDQHSERARAQTRELLTNPTQRERAANESQATRDAHTKAKELGTDIDGVYQLSADIMDELVKHTGGDVNIMKALMEQAARDPAAFARSLKPEQQQKIRELALPVKPPVDAGK